MSAAMNYQFSQRVKEKYNNAGAGNYPGKPAPKRIIICCDGTWQSAVSGEKNIPSNVTRIARNIKKTDVDQDGKEWQQIVWYDSGVGTTSGALGQIREGAFGIGLEGNVIEAYNFVVLNYNWGDKIYCFGFSRGAYTARTIAGVISDIGICDPDCLHEFPELWQEYRAHKGGRFWKSQKYWDFIDGRADSARPDGSLAKPGHSKWAYGGQEIELVGVFDTVGSIGMPAVRGVELTDRVGFHNVHLNRNIKRAFHALALDEYREAFSPTLWRLPEAQTNVTEEDIDKQVQIVNQAFVTYRSPWSSPDTRTLAEKQEALYAWQREKIKQIQLEEELQKPSELSQVWFPGAHIQVGGGSSDTLTYVGDLEEISTVTMAWMFEQISPYLGIDRTKFSLEDMDRRKYVEEHHAKIRSEQEQREKEAAAAKKSWGKSIARGISSAVGAIRHPIQTYYGPDTGLWGLGWATSDFPDSYGPKYYANGPKYRTPGAYTLDSHTKETGQTNESIHPCVGWRLKKKPDYKVAGQVKISHKDDGSYVIGGVSLPEYQMRKDLEYYDSFERVILVDEEVKAYVEGLVKK